MVRKLILAAVILTLGLGTVGCGGASSSANSDNTGMKYTEGADKKGNKTKMVEAGASLEPEKK